jgi:hypothetical protein
MSRSIPWKRSSKTLRIGCMTFIIRTRSSSRRQEVAKSRRRRRINLSKLSKIGERKRKETPPLKTKGKVSLSLPIY